LVFALRLTLFIPDLKCAIADAFLEFWLPLHVTLLLQCEIALVPWFQNGELPSGDVVPSEHPSIIQLLTYPAVGSLGGTSVRSAPLSTETAQLKKFDLTS
jgi:hypothetical protein